MKYLENMTLEIQRIVKMNYAIAFFLHTDFIP